MVMNEQEFKQDENGYYVELPDPAYRMNLDTPAADIGSDNTIMVTIEASDELKEWLVEHNILDMNLHIDTDPLKFYIVFRDAAEAVMFKLAWSDRR
jgi:hypothetical protein